MIGHFAPPFPLYRYIFSYNGKENNCSLLASMVNSLLTNIAAA